MTTKGVSFRPSPRGQISAAVDNPALRPDPDIQAAMTMVGRLVAHEEDMATALTTYSCSTPTRRGAFLVSADL